MSTPLREAIQEADALALPSASAARFLSQVSGVTCAHIYAQGARAALAFDGSLPIQISNGLYAEDLAQSIHARQPSVRVTILQGDLARPNLQAELERLGHEVRTLTVYENRCSPHMKSTLAHCRGDLSGPAQSNASRLILGCVRFRPLRLTTTAAALRSGDCTQIIQAKAYVESLIAELEKL